MVSVEFFIKKILTNLPPSCANDLGMGKPQLLGALKQDLFTPVQGLLYLYLWRVL